MERNHQTRENNLTTLKLYYANIFGDVDIIDNVIEITLNDGSIKKIFMETKSSFQSSYNGGIYTTDDKIFKLLMEALLNDVDVPKCIPTPCVFVSWSSYIWLFDI